MKTPIQWKKRYQSKKFTEWFTAEEAVLGVTCTEGGTSFLLWSPFSKSVTLTLYADGEKSPAREQLPMKRERFGLWSYETKDCLHGVYYDYELTSEEGVSYSADPYAKACGVNGIRSMAVDLSRTNPPEWEADQVPELPAETVVYELHVKEFSWQEEGGFPKQYRGKYKAFTCQDTTLCGDGKSPTGLGWIKELGVTHIQLMPVYDFGSVDEQDSEQAFNWGYDPLNWNIPEGSYATDPFKGEVRIRELKEMIQSLHRQGFRVIMDVVYNHSFSLESWLQKTVPWYFYRVWDHGEVSNGSGCGNDLASERRMCAKYILESVMYWAEEYHMDGFRFDLMGLLDVELMNRIQQGLDERFGKGEKLVYGEPWAAGSTAMEAEHTQALKENMHLLNESVGMFCDVTRDVVKGSVFAFGVPGFVNGAKGLEDQLLSAVKACCTEQHGQITVKAPSQVVSYVSSHDNQTLWDKLTATVADETMRKRVYRLAAGIYMTCQGHLFFLSGEEWFRTKGGEDNTYNAPIGLNRLDWVKAWEEKELADYYKGLIALRKQLPGLCDKTPEARQRITHEWKEDGMAGFRVSHYPERESSPWKSIMVVYNRNQKGKQLDLPEGEWELLADADNSFLWKNQQRVKGAVRVKPVSILILGERERE